MISNMATNINNNKKQNQFLFDFDRFENEASILIDKITKINLKKDNSGNIIGTRAALSILEPY